MISMMLHLVFSNGLIVTINARYSHCTPLKIDRDNIVEWDVKETNIDTKVILLNNSANT